uniref:Uncharacterized protein n=1 Tax=Tanacetum cinerariifolium TaxID=118510 RepID=A0A699IBL2_TANCI|nr:hypothetical protein [Tanacetum cinerariifolium]
MSSLGAPSAGPSTPPSYSSGPSTPPNYSSGSSRNAECSNCKHLCGKISVLKATINMYMHPEQHTVNLAALLHEVLNEMEKLDLESSSSCHGIKMKMENVYGALKLLQRWWENISSGSQKFRRVEVLYKLEMITGDLHHYLRSIITAIAPSPSQASRRRDHRRHALTITVVMP